MNILGLTSAFNGFHDSSAVWVKDGKIELALSEERFTRIKHDRSFSENCIHEILKQSGMKSLNDFDGIAIAWKPYNAFSGFFSRNVFDVPSTLLYSLFAQPTEVIKYAWNNFIRFKIITPPNNIFKYGVDRQKIHFLSHHLSHGASAFRTSGFSNAISVNLDCFGPDAERNLWSGAAYHCINDQMELIEYIPTYASMGLFYSTVSVCLGFKFGDGEGKTMGLSAYGNPDIAYDALRVIAPSFKNGRWVGHASWSDFRVIDNPKLLYHTRWGSYLKNIVKNNKREDVAAAAQRILEEELSNYFDYLITKTGIRNIVLAGGIFLNVKFNRILSERSDVDKVYVHPFPSDGGTAAGAALELYAQLSGQKTNYEMPTAHLGTAYNDDAIREAIEKYDDKIKHTKHDEISIHAAQLISEGKIIGWFQGRSEWGPRALGNRSVLGDPRNEGTKQRLNMHLKSRDWFMPFAPSILREYMDEYFHNCFYTPFMTFAFKVRAEKMAVIPAAIHHDGTARPNSVDKNVNPMYYALIDHFRKISGIPIVLNTSFNRHGLPLINTPTEAIDHLLWGCVDVLCIGSYLIERAQHIEEVDKFSQEALKTAYVEENAFEEAFKSKNS